MAEGSRRRVFIILQRKQRTSSGLNIHSSLNRTNMSHLTYSVYEGEGEYLSNFLRYSQAVRVGDRIEISGQGESKHNKFCNIER